MVLVLTDATAFAQTMILCPSISIIELACHTTYTFREVASEALKVKVEGFNENKVNLSDHKIGDAEATALAKVHKQMPMCM